MKTLLFKLFKQHFAIVAFYASLLLFYFFPLFQDAHSIFDNYTDFGYFYPERFFGFSLFKKGVLPLWNPYIFSGMPYMADYESALFYVPNLIFMFIPVQKAIYLSIALHMLFAGYGTFLISRFYKCSWLSSCAGGLVFMLSGFMTAGIYAMHLTIINAVAWIPLIFLLFLKLLRKPCLLYSGLLALSCSFMFMAGGAQLSYYMGLFLVFFYGLDKISIFIKKDDIQTAVFHRKEIGLLCLSAGLTLMLCAVQLLPTMETAFMTERADIKIGPGFESFHPIQFLMFFIPDIFGNPVNLTYFGKLNHGEACYYTGVLSIVMLIILFFIKKDRTIITFFLSGAVVLLLACCANIPYFKYICNYIPLFRHFRLPGRILPFYVFIVAIMTSFGLNLLSEAQLSVRVRINKILKVLFVICGASFLLSAVLYMFKGAILAITRPKIFACIADLYYNKNRGRHNPLSHYLEKIKSIYTMETRLIFIFSVLLILSLTTTYLLYRSSGRRKQVWLVLAIALIGIDLLFLGVKFRKTIDYREFSPREEVVDFLSRDKTIYRFLATDNSFSYNYGMIYNLQNVNGYSSLSLKNYRSFLGAAQRKEMAQVGSGITVDITNYTSPLLSLLNIKYLLSTQLISSDGWEFVSTLKGSVYKRQDYQDLKMIHPAKINLYKKNNLFPRAVLFDNYIIEPDINKAYQALCLFSEDELRRTVYLEGKPNLDKNNKLFENSEAAGMNKVVIENYSPDKIELIVQNRDKKILFLSEIFYPGWNAYIDGVKTEVLKANGIFRAIAVPYGVHKIVFNFEPGSFRIGAVFSITAILFLCGIFFNKLTIFYLKKR